jgi:hypothetical protein
MRYVPSDQSMVCCLHWLDGLRKTGSLDGKVGSLVRDTSVAQVATDSTALASGATDWVSSTTKLHDLVLGKVSNGHNFVGVSELHSSGDLVCSDARAEGRVDNHAALAVAGKDDLSGGALGERGSDEIGHHLAAVSTTGSVTLDCCQ